MAVFICPSCGHSQDVFDWLIGRKTKCLKCQTPGTIAPGEIARAAASPQTARRTPRSAAGNYPNLLRYLDWSGTLAKVFLVLGMICVALLAVVSVFDALGQPSDGLQKLLGLVISIGFSALSALIVYVAFVAAMAGIEIVRVLIDIEANTRTSG